MGKLVDGQWTTQWYETKATGGRFVRESSSFRHAIESTGPFPAQVGRYHLFVSLACPWAHRTLLVRVLKGLEHMVSVSGCVPLMLENGWELDPEQSHPADARFMYELYQAQDAHYTGRVTVPVLYDKVEGVFVNNESSEIVRIFNDAFDHLGATKLDLYPKAHRAEIDAVNDRVYRDVNNGVYKAGFATQQSVYDEAVDALFETLDWLDQRLSERQWLVGGAQTEADWRLFPTLVRFDAVYYHHFKCSVRRVQDYTHLSAYLNRLLEVPGVRQTIDLPHARAHYFGSHPTVNPHGIVPRCPPLGFSA